MERAENESALEKARRAVRVGEAGKQAEADRLESAKQARIDAFARSAVETVLGNSTLSKVVTRSPEFGKGYKDKKILDTLVKEADAESATITSERDGILKERAEIEGLSEEMLPQADREAALGALSDQERVVSYRAAATSERKRGAEKAFERSESWAQARPRLNDAASAYPLSKKEYEADTSISKWREEQNVIQAQVPPTQAYTNSILRDVERTIRDLETAQDHIANPAERIKLSPEEKRAMHDRVLKEVIARQVQDAQTEEMRDFETDASTLTRDIEQDLETFEKDVEGVKKQMEDFGKRLIAMESDRDFKAAIASLKRGFEREVKYIARTLSTRAELQKKKQALQRELTDMYAPLVQDSNHRNLTGIAGKIWLKTGALYRMQIVTNEYNNLPRASSFNQSINTAARNFVGEQGFQGDVGGKLKTVQDSISALTVAPESLAMQLRSKIEALLPTDKLAS